METSLNPRASAKIVIGVDDQRENLILLESALRAGGFHFFGASSGAECLSLATRIQPRLILLDIQMPDMDGFETCRRLRAMGDMRQVPVAFLTGRRNAEDVKRCLEVGGNDFIVKPFDVIKLLERVRHWTSRKVA